LNHVDPYRQGDLWEYQCSGCPILKACGVTESAPCGCNRTGEDRYDCSNCDTLCRELFVTSQNGSQITFLNHVFEGRDLFDVHLNQPPLSLPLLVPLQTHLLPSNFRLHLDCVGIDLRYLLSRHKKPPLQHCPSVEKFSNAQEYARVNPDSKVIAVLNGKDKILDRFWASRWINILETLQRWGISLASGPTFSVYKVTKDGRPIPDSHSVSMLRRHHRVVQELASLAYTTLPNIYWRNEKDLKDWSEWLLRNDSVSVVSRDFTLPKRGKSKRRSLNQLLQTLAKVGRPFHILFQGFGRVQAADIMRDVAEYGFTCTFATSDPVIAGIKGKSFIFQDQETPLLGKEPTTNKYSLAERNVYTLQKHLIAVAQTL